jgi:hypothetical protein
LEANATDGKDKYNNNDDKTNLGIIMLVNRNAFFFGGYYCYADVFASYQLWTNERRFSIIEPLTKKRHV